MFGEWIIGSVGASHAIVACKEFLLYLSPALLG